MINTLVVACASLNKPLQMEEGSVGMGKGEVPVKPRKAGVTDYKEAVSTQRGTEGGLCFRQTDSSSWMHHLVLCLSLSFLRV